MAVEGLARMAREVRGEMTATAAAGLAVSRRTVIQAAALSLVAAGFVAAIPNPVFAADPSAARFATTLGPDERALFDDYMSARTLHDFKLDAFWREVSNKRAQRKAKKKRGDTLLASDYAEGFPPKYTGPTLPEALAKRWAAFQAAEEEQGKREPPQPKPGLADFLALAKSVYNFTPEIIPEREFKLRYAREALSLGLTKDQVVRVYALETSGLGTADMVSGIHPIKKTGTPISTAIGYAQLLAANTTDELTRHGPKFLAASRRRHRTRATTWAAARSLTTSTRNSRPCFRQQVHPRQMGQSRRICANGSRSRHSRDQHRWRHRSLATGSEASGPARDGGEGRHRVFDRRRDRAHEPRRPGTALEMMQPAGLKATTPNFFERNAYGRNTIVRDKTSAELLVALNKRMEDNIGNAGAIEFAAAFDQAASERQSVRN